MYVCMYMYIYIYIYVYVYISSSLSLCIYIYIYIQYIVVVRKGANGVNTSGLAANLMFLTEGLFWVLPLIYFYLLKSARAYLFHTYTYCI